VVAEYAVADVRQLIDGLRWDRRCHPYHGRREYSERAEEVCRAIGIMLSVGMAAEAVPLARRAVERVTAALQYMDDSTGLVGDDLRALMDMYARACQEAPPDARRLAAWLVTMQLDGPGWPRIELKEFAAALGERGLAEVARLTEERRVATDPESWTATWGIKDLREQLAAVSGDADAHVAVLAEDLRAAYRYGEIANVLCVAGRAADAEQWARKGLAEYPAGYQTDKLRDQLADLLLDDNRGAEAVAVHREIFEQRALRQDYTNLRTTARQAGQWDSLAGWALDLMRDRVRADSRHAGDLITVLVDEDLDDEAWATAIAHSRQVHASQWYSLVELREIDHPADVIVPYQDLIEIRMGDTGDKYRYPRAIKTIKRLGEAYYRAGDGTGFAAYLEHLRVRHKRKTSFITKLDAARLP
jgi:hypothetical protein